MKTARLTNDVENQSMAISSVKGTTFNPSLSGGLVNLLNRFSALNKEVTVLQVQMFLHIASNPGITQRALWEHFGKEKTSDSVVSRNVAILSDLGARESAKMGLIKMEVNPSDRRERWLSPTRKGEQLVSDILNDLGQKRRS